jgi:hypothetical protein
MTVTLAVMGCGGDLTTEPAAGDLQAYPLIDNLAWTPVAGSDDPRADHRPADATCPDGAWYEEDGALDVETGFCTYLAVSQPALSAVDPGDPLEIIAWHANLGDGDGTPAHLAVLLGDTVAWEATVDMPADAEVYQETFPSPVALAEGEPVGLHLHNHGYNSWTILSLEVTR